MTLRILGVNGSMRARAHSASALTVALEAAGERGAEIRTLDLRRTLLPMYNPDVEVAETGEVREALAAVEWANAFVLATPDYHGSMSGAMKNFLDHFWTEFAGKVFTYVCASHEKGLTAMDQMRTAVRQCYGWSLPYGVAVNPEEDLDAEGNVTRTATIKRLRMLARDLTIYGTLISEQFERDLLSDDTHSFAARYRK
ncbi:MAG: NAD(P)H-dependent oxidoreductase [Pyrinomonadaceae bacterium]